MRIVIAKGGLGNTMFQYALVMALRHCEQTPCQPASLLVMKVHLWEHNGYELRRVFPKIKEIDPNCKLYQKVYLRAVSIFKSIRCKKVKNVTIGQLFKGYNVVDEEGISCRNMDNVVFDGYFQKCCYAERCRTALLSDFVFDTSKLSAQTIRVKKQIESSCSVSVHVRRGDYLTATNKEDFAGVCTEDYYQRAIAYMKKVNPNIRLFVFSDDIAYAKSIFSKENAVFIDFNEGKDSWQDMYLMSKCKHNIIANSTFSWWGAWLNVNHSKIVIAPRLWFANDAKEELIPSNWIRM